MIDLKCKLMNCKFNKDSNCIANEISVNESAVCKSFEPIKGKMQQSDKLPMPLVNHNVCVNCDAKCIFKKNDLCIANGITVLDEKGNKQQADCSTFMPK